MIKLSNVRKQSFIYTFFWDACCLLNDKILQKLKTRGWTGVEIGLIESFKVKVFKVGLTQIIKTIARMKKPVMKLKTPAAQPQLLGSTCALI